MEKIIFWGILAVIVLGPTLGWRIYKMHRYSRLCKEFVSKPFVCPNCGHRFYTTQKFIQPISEHKAILKCPKCGKRDVCGRPYDFEDK